MASIQYDAMSRSANVSFRLRPETKKRLDQAADEDRRPLSQFLEILVEDYLDERDAKKKAGKK